MTGARVPIVQTEWDSLHLHLICTVVGIECEFFFYRRNKYFRCSSVASPSRRPHGRRCFTPFISWHDDNNIYNLMYRNTCY